MIIGATCATYYRTSIRRVRRNVRDDVNREMAKLRLETDVESLEWLNSFVLKFWPIYQPVLAATIINTVDQVLAGATPAFLDSLRMTTFTLGTKPPRIEHVKTYPKTEDDIVEMDWAFGFTPNDTDDLSSRQLKNKINPKVVLEIRVGKGIASKGIPIIVEDMAFSGTMKVKIKLQIAFPHIEKVDVCFLGKPKVDFGLKPLGGDMLGFDVVGFLPGLKGFIDDQIHGNIGPMFYSPNIFTVEVAKMLGGAPLDAAIGVLSITIHNAHGLKNSDKFSGTPDPYTVLSINQRAELARTKHIPESADPKWNETHNLVISNLNESLTLQIFDYNDIRKDKELGVASFSLEKLQEEPEQDNLSLPVLSNGKPRGSINFDVRFFPILEGRILEDGTKEPPPEVNSGVVRYTISQAKDLDHSKSMVGQLSPYAQMIMNGKKLFQSPIKKRTNNPVFEESHEILVTDRKSCKLGVIIKDDRDFADDPVLGKYQISLNDLLTANEKGTDWFNLSGAKTGRVKLTADWKPVALKGGAGTGGYVTPVGVMRLHFQSARELRNLEALGKSDPYVRVLLAGVQKARSVTFENDLDPDWDEILYVPVHSAREKLMFEVMDQESMGKDRSLGSYELDLAEFIQVDSEGLYQPHEEKFNRSEGLRKGNKGAAKGVLNFTAAFYPCMNIADPEEEKEEKAASDKAASENEVTAEKTASSVSLEVPQEATNALTSPLSPTFSITSEDDDNKKAPVLRLSPEELLTHESGLLIFNIIEGQFAHKDCYLEVVMDDMSIPAYTSSKIRSRHTKFEEIGDAVVRELDFSRMTLRLREHGKDVDEEVQLASLAGNTMETLKRCLNNPTVLVLKGKDGDLNKITVSLKYIPLLMKLDPSESINNMGSLRVDVLDAANLPAADRNGKSDPFCVFKLDGKELHKTKIQKKTLHPAWNEVFETKVSSRTANKLEVEIFDWDIAGGDDFLGKGDIDMTGLQPFTPATSYLKLRGKNNEEGKFGELRLRMLFTPTYVTRSRQGSSTFHGTFATPGKIVTGVAGAPLKVGGFAAGGIVKGASFLKKNTFGRIGGKDTGVLEEEELMPTRPTSSGSGLVEPMGAGPQDPALALHTTTTQGSKHASLSPGSANVRGTSPHARSRSSSSQLSVPGVISSGAEQGVATIRIISGSGFPAPTNLQFRVRALDKSKDAHKTKTNKAPNGEASFDEQFTAQCSADTQFKIYAKDNHMIKDTELGEGLFVIDDTGSGQETIVPVGEGKVVLRTSFRAADAGSISPKGKRGLLRRG